MCTYTVQVDSASHLNPHENALTMNLVGPVARYDNPIAESSQLYPQPGTMNLATAGVKASWGGEKDPSPHPLFSYDRKPFVL